MHYEYKCHVNACGCRVKHVGSDGFSWTLIEPFFFGLAKDGLEALSWRSWHGDPEISISEDTAAGIVRPMISCGQVLG